METAMSVAKKMPPRKAKVALFERHLPRQGIEVQSLSLVDLHLRVKYEPITNQFASAPLVASI
jgi:hypothetical protein